MAQDQLPEWPAPSPVDLAAAYDQHATLARWLADHAPEDITDELAAASDRAHSARVAGRDTKSAGADLAALVARQRRRDEWVVAHRNEITAWSRLEGDLRRYEYRLGQAASYTQPEHVTGLLGPLPERVGRVEKWQSAAGAIEAYRTRWKIAGSATLGPEPADPERRAHWDRTVSIVGTTRSLTADDTFASGSDRASLGAQWVSTHSTDLERKDDLSMARSSIPPTVPFWTDEPYPDLDSGLELWSFRDLRG